MTEDLSGLARECRMVSRARALTEWAAAGRPITAKGVLRRADVADAAGAIGVTAPAWVRTAADLPELHHPWLLAWAAGWLRIEGAVAMASSPPAGGDPLTAWSAGLDAVLREESHDRGRRGARLAWDGPEAAFYDVRDRGGLAALESGAHPDLAVLRHAIDEFTASAVREKVLQLKITLVVVRPAVWRRVLIPASATLGDLHRVIQVVFDWDTDHLHRFTTQSGHYADPYHELEECDDEDLIRLSRVLPRTGTKISYLYDFGDSWNHTITLEKIHHPETTPTHPACIAGRGDAPVEDWDPDSDEPGTTPFDRDRLNHHLATLNSAATVG